METFGSILMVSVSKENKKKRFKCCILLLYPTDSGNYN